jgi:predicted TIM-barrel fold metal-dependent hydrolase
MSTAYEKIREHVFGLEIIDTHEHLPPAESRRDMSLDVLGEYLQVYFNSDLVSAGLPVEQLKFLRDPRQPLAKRWKAAEPFWEAARGTGYGRVLDIAARDLYGLPRIDGGTIGELNERFQAARAAGDTYRTVLQEKSKIRLAVLDAMSDVTCDRTFFRPAVRLDSVLMVGADSDLSAVAAQAGMRAVHTLEDLEEAMRRIVDRYIAAGAVCLKSTLAYYRPLRFEKVTRAEAEAEFHQLFAERNLLRADWPYPKANWLPKLQDHLMHCLCRLAEERELVFQIHTGLQEGYSNFIYQSDPAPLATLFAEYRGVKFDVFHIGYPYQGVVTVLAKNFANVYVDFCWAHVMSPTAAVHAMAEMLDAVPANKISGFGGDYGFVDGVYGHQVIARQNVARALAIQVEQGGMDVDRAGEVAKMILHDNPAALFGLPGPSKPATPRKR